MADLRLRTFIEFILRGAGLKVATQDLEQFSRSFDNSKRAMERAQGEALRMNRAYDQLVKLGLKPVFGQAEAVRAKIEALNRAQASGVGVVGGYGKAFKALRAELAALEGTGGSSLGRFTGSILAFAKSVGPAIAAFIGIRAAIDAVKGFAADDKAFRQTGALLDSIGINADKTLPRVKAFTTALEDQHGVLDDESLPAFNRFLGILHDVDGAMFATQLAAKLTAGGYGEMGEVSEQLAAIIEGKTKGAVSAFGVTLRDANGHARDTRDILKEMIDRAEKTGNTADTASGQLARFNVQLDHLKDSGGQIVSGVLPLLNGLLAALSVIIRVSFAQAAGAIGTATDALIIFARGFTKLADFKTLATDPAQFFKNLASFGKESFSTLKGDASDWLRNLQEAYNKGLESFTVSERGKGVVLDEALKKRAELEAQAARDSAERVLQARIAATESGTRERLNLELQLIDLQARNEIAKIAETGKTVEQIRAEQRTQRAAKEDAFERERAKANEQLQIQALQAEIAAAEEGSPRRLALEQQLQERLRAIAVREATAKEQDLAAVGRAFDAQEEARAKAQAQKIADARRAERVAPLQTIEPLAPPGSDARLEIERLLLAEEEAAAIESAQRTGASVEAIREQFRAKDAAAFLRNEKANDDAALRLTKERIAREREALEGRTETQKTTAGGGSQIRNLDADKALLAEKLRLDLEELDAETANAVKAEEDKRQILLGEIARTQQEIDDLNLQLVTKGLSDEEVALLESLQRRKAAEIATAKEIQDALNKIHKHALETRVGYEGKAADATTQIDTGVMHTKEESQRAVAASGAAFIQQAFAQNKAAAIVSAIINTALGVTQALASYPPPYSYILAAITAAAGAVEIATIQRANIGGGSTSASSSAQTSSAKPKGFDSPQSDREARVGGHRWARDMVREWTAGVAAGAAGKPVPPPAGTPGTPTTKAERTLAEGWSKGLTGPTEGRGFDVPRHDRIAYMGGREWADTPIARGLTDRMSETTRAITGGTTIFDQRSTATTTDNRQTHSTTIEGAKVEVNLMGNLLNDERAMRQVARKVQQALDRDQARRIR